MICHTIRSPTPTSAPLLLCFSEVVARLLIMCKYKKGYFSAQYKRVWRDVKHVTTYKTTENTAGNKQQQQQVGWVRKTLPRVPIFRQFFNLLLLFELLQPVPGTEIMTIVRILSTFRLRQSKVDLKYSVGSKLIQLQLKKKKDLFTNCTN